MKDLLLATTITDAIMDYDLTNVEPFTLVIADWNRNLNFLELVWDGVQKHYKELPLEPMIWSSSTLYSESMKLERKNWFETFKMKNDIDAKSLLNFHQTAGNGNLDFGVVMNRGFVKTTSITQIEKRDMQVEMRYNNLNDGTTYSKTFNLSQLIND